MQNKTCSYVTGQILAVMEAIQLAVPGEDRQHHVTVFAQQLRNISAQPHLYLIKALRKVTETYLPLVSDEQMEYFQSRLTDLVGALDDFPRDDRCKRLGDDYMAGYFAEAKAIREVIRP